MTPEFLKFSDIEKLKSNHPELIIDDQIHLAIEELFDIKYPDKKDSKTKEEVAEFQESLTEGNINEWGCWVYYKWLNRLVHFPYKEDLRALRTSRNRNLINTEEQKTLADSTIAIIGMSVGSNIVEALVSQGIGQRLILVDMDSLEPSNLNRIRSPYYHVGLHKVEAISRKVYEIDPYIVVIPFNDGLNSSNLAEVLDYKPNIVIDEMDELKMKILLREEAKKRNLPIIMAADDGDDALIDIERYDLEPELEIFSGAIPQDILEKIKSEKIPRPQLGMMIGKYFVGSKNIPLRMFESLGEVGKTLPSWPQLGGAAALSGVTLAYICKKILLGQKIRTGRVLISLDEKIDLERLDDAHQAELKKFQAMLEG
jgi:molybdopterin/thiamine biosynthesis adenylyltransferase